MGFIWVETITKGVTPLKADHINELHTNINAVRGFIHDPTTCPPEKALKGYAWARDPIVKESHIVLASDFIEMQTALDEAYDKNVCITDLSANNKVHNGAERATHDSTYKGTHNVGYDSDHRVSHYGTNNAVNDSGDLSGNDSSVKAAYYGTHKVSIQGTDFASDLTPYTASKNFADNTLHRITVNLLNYGSGG